MKLRRPLDHTRPLALAAALACAATLAACVGYANYSPIQGDTAQNDPSAIAPVDIMIAGLRWVSDRYSVDGPYAVNFPTGINAQRAAQILEQTGDPLARTLTSETQDLPTFHVSRIIVRGSQAEMDVLRPITNLTGQRGEPVLQPITLRLQGGLRRWRVRTSQAWTIGAADAPPLNFVDAPPLDNVAASPERAPETADDSPQPDQLFADPFASETDAP